VKRAVLGLVGQTRTLPAFSADNSTKMEMGAATINMTIVAGFSSSISLLAPTRPADRCPKELRGGFLDNRVDGVLLFTVSARFS